MDICGQAATSQRSFSMCTPLLRPLGQGGGKRRAAHISKVAVNPAPPMLTLICDVPHRLPKMRSATAWASSAPKPALSNVELGYMSENLRRAAVGKERRLPVAPKKLCMPFCARARGSPCH
mmetsp:Transcript_123488/g.349030  ORF Transcript_123488/g.349030 Transcript_123488/m.349030 type:complete len:121 (+) Transcript_123488:1169-1531(+)